METCKFWTRSQLPIASQDGADGADGGLSPRADSAVYVVGRLWALGQGLRAIELEVNTRSRVRDGYSGVSAEYESQVL